MPTQYTYKHTYTNEQSCTAWKCLNACLVVISLCQYMYFLCGLKVFTGLTARFTTVAAEAARRSTIYQHYPHDRKAETSIDPHRSPNSNLAGRQAPHPKPSVGSWAEFFHAVHKGSEGAPGFKVRHPPSIKPSGLVASLKPKERATTP